MNRREAITALMSLPAAVFVAPFVAKAPTISGTLKTTLHLDPEVFTEAVLRFQYGSALEAAKRFESSMLSVRRTI